MSEHHEDPPRVPVIVIGTDGIEHGFLTSDEHGDKIELDEDPFRARGYCEDYPCCGHEAGDCYGQKYGSDEDIKRRAIERMEMEDQGYFSGEEEW